MAAILKKKMVARNKILMVAIMFAHVANYPKHINLALKSDKVDIFAKMAAILKNGLWFGTIMFNQHQHVGHT